MADVVIGAKLEADASGAINNVKSFKQQLREAQEEVITLSQRFGETSKEAAAAAKHVASLKDQMGDAKDLIDAFNPDSFRAFSAGVNTVVGGFTALQGVMGLVGVESEAVEKTLLKVQSALALSQGIAQLQEGVGVFKSLGAAIQQTTIFQKANAAATAVTSAVMKAFGVNVVATSTAFNVLKGAIIATGIGALVIGLTIAVQALSSFKEETDEAAEAQERLEKNIERTNNSLDFMTSALDREAKVAIARAKAQGKSEEEIFNIEQGYRRRKLKETEEAFYKLSELQGLTDQNTLKNIRNLHTEIEVAEFNHQERLLNKRKEAAEKARKEAEAERKAEIERLAQIQTRDTLNQVGGFQVEIAKTPEQLALEAEIAARAQARKDKEAYDQYTIESTKLFTEIHARNVAERIANEQAEFEAKQTIANASANILGTLSELFGRQTKAGKILALAEIAQGTAVGFINGLDIAQKSAKGTGPAAAFAFPIFYATQIAAVLGAAAKAKAVLGSSGGGVGGGGSVTAPTASAAPLVPQPPERTTTTLDQQSLNAIGNATTRAFFLEADFDDRERVVRLNRMARLGD